MCVVAMVVVTRDTGMTRFAMFQSDSGIPVPVGNMLHDITTKTNFDVVFPLSHHIFPLFHLKCYPFVVLSGQLSRHAHHSSEHFTPAQPNAVPGIGTNFSFTFAMILATPSSSAAH